MHSFGVIGIFPSLTNNTKKLLVLTSLTDDGEILIGSRSWGDVNIGNLINELYQININNRWWP
ncbi:MAG: hypothetical protein CM15mP111_3010 [Hyphomicrobiales bacterium]|nr:MAG: hypothetical protein CM15mP111_3010 [Hyphomicrobiales bacterium]